MNIGLRQGYGHKYVVVILIEWCAPRGVRAVRARTGLTSG